MSNLPLCWIRSNNLGDALNPILYEKIAGKYPKYANPYEFPKVIAIGSVMSWALPTDTVWGTGCMFEHQSLSCNNTTRFNAVRGPLTADLLTKFGINLSDNMVLGDPALLLPRFIPRSPTIPGKIGFLPHYSDYGRIVETSGDITPIYPMTDTLDMIKQITSCEMVIASSLHGIIVPEAYGIPAVWVELSDNVAGSGFKFRDYYLSTGRTVKSLDWRDECKWSEARRAAKNWTMPHLDTSGLLESCPFTKMPMFIDPSPSCQIESLNTIYERYLGLSGTFVEVGGSDGYTWSNTWHLAEMGWQGIYYEPDKEMVIRCAEHHAKNNVQIIPSCVGNFNGSIRLYHGKGATTNDHVAVTDLYHHGNSINDFEYMPIVTLNSSLENMHIPKDFDLLVIDVNGDEPMVLCGLNLENWCPKMIIVATHLNHPKWNFNADIIYRMLMPWYVEVYHDHINSIFVRTDDHISCELRDRSIS